MASSPGEIHEALEAVAVRRNSAIIDPPANASKADITLTRKSLLAFLDEIEGDTSVCEVREALEDYPNG